MTEVGTPAPDGAADGWDGFARALGHELKRLPMEATLIIIERGNPLHYAQFFQDKGELQAEAPGGTFDDPIGSLSMRDRRLLAAVGWREPTREDEVPNWTIRLPWPATTGEYERLTAAVVTALRDVQEIPAPASLVYRSWELTNRRRAVGLPGVEPDEGYAPEEDGAA
ncbi:TY-Chap domain-containing protein [Rugosimonospora africana]|uniref:TY-Chap N-terminal domain-containing protein n=1 Tax=Rugosimonospora africana TaxID=556532 RepID=A0A8J3QN50_9ACTN|nr:hypothetical protein [Rugosimonospora africana]GIH14073.1 hypothetical protein Raf01_22450 [Rugosimonospora africana]